MSIGTDLKLLELIQNSNKTIEGLVKTNLELIPIVRDLARRVNELEAKQPTTSEQEVYFSEQLIQGALSLKTDIERMCQRYELGGIPPTERQVQMNIERMKIQYANTVLEAL